MQGKEGSSVRQSCSSKVFVSGMLLFRWINTASTPMVKCLKGLGAEQHNDGRANSRFQMLHPRTDHIRGPNA